MNAPPAIRSSMVSLQHAHRLRTWAVTRMAAWTTFCASLAVALGLLLFSSAAWAFTPPAKDGPVTDLAQVLGTAEKTAIAQKIVKYKDSQNFTIVVLTLPTLSGEQVDDVSFATAKAWKIGDVGRDSGVLLLVSTQERKIRIEVGKGLEGDLTDLQSNDIIRNVIGPRLKTGDYAGGISNGVDAIAAALAKQPMPASAKAPPPSKASVIGGGVAIVIVFGLFLLLFVLVAVSIVRSALRRGSTNGGPDRYNNNDIGFTMFGIGAGTGAGFGSSSDSGSSDSGSSDGSGFGGSGSGSSGGSDFGGGGGDFGGGGSSGDY